MQSKTIIGGRFKIIKSIQKEQLNIYKVFKIKNLLTPSSFILSHLNGKSRISRRRCINRRSSGSANEPN